jgi:mRNA interferase RelE/StbE
MSSQRHTPPPRRQTAAAPKTPAQPVEVWLTDPAVDDLRRLDGAALVWALKKMLLLESNPHAGEPLLGNLVGYRKLVVGDRDWRIVWRTTTDDRGGVVIEIAEVWAVGARADSEVYAEMTSRVAAMVAQPAKRPLASVIEALGKAAKGVTARPPYEPPPTPEPWLVDLLVRTVGLDRATVEAMTVEEAMDAWADYRNKPKP